MKSVNEFSAREQDYFYRFVISVWISEEKQPRHKEVQETLKASENRIKLDTKNN